MQSMFLRIVSGLAVGLAICAAGAWWYVGRRDFGVQHVPFDSAAWKQSPAKDSPQSMRLRMFDDLNTNHELEGMTREELIELLGEPDPQSDEFKEFDMVYHLGRERSPLGVDDDWLVIRLDEEKKSVAEASLKVKRVK